MNIKDLLANVRAAVAPSRELDDVIGHALEFQYDGDPITRKMTSDGVGCVRFDSLGGWDEVPRYTASIDAALALVERKLPGWTVASMSQGDNKLWTVELREGFLTSYNRVVMQPDHWQGTTLPLAILAGLLVALSEAQP